MLFVPAIASGGPGGEAGLEPGGEMASYRGAKILTGVPFEAAGMQAFIQKRFALRSPQRWIDGSGKL